MSDLINLVLLKTKGHFDKIEKFDKLYWGPLISTFIILMSLSLVIWKEVWQPITSASLSSDFVLNLTLCPKEPAKRH